MHSRAHDPGLVTPQTRGEDLALFYDLAELPGSISVDDISLRTSVTRLSRV